MRPLIVIDPSCRNPEEEGAARVRRGWRGPVELYRPALFDDERVDPDRVAAAAGVVVMGSGASVDDDRPWLPGLRSLVDRMLERDDAPPLLGICFGHQLVGRQAGAQVGLLFSDGAKRLGVETSRVESCRLLGEATELQVVASHREEVQTLPDGFEIVARRDGVAIDGFQHRSRPIFGFQFHPEAGPEFASHVGLDPQSIDERVLADGARLLGAFIDLCERNGC